jgi:hypothetical protein
VEAHALDAVESAPARLFPILDPHGWSIEHMFGRFPTDRSPILTAGPVENDLPPSTGARLGRALDE